MAAGSSPPTGTLTPGPRLLATGLWALRLCSCPIVILHSCTVAESKLSRPDPHLYEDKHWLSDVVLSAALGTVLGKAVVALNKDRRDTGLSVVPLAAPGTWGAAMQYRY
jgi:hypothetical protein